MPLYELYGKPDMYGPMLDALPQLLSRYNLNCITGQLMTNIHFSCSDWILASERVLTLPRNGLLA